MVLIGLGMEDDTDTVVDCESVTPLVVPQRYRHACQYLLHGEPEETAQPSRRRQKLHTHTHQVPRYRRPAVLFFLRFWFCRSVTVDILRDAGFLI